MTSLGDRRTWTDVTCETPDAPPRPAPPPPPLMRCASCYLIIGARRIVVACSFCEALLCAHCVDNVPGGQKWCGDCELPKSTSLASSSALFPSKALSSARDVRQHSMSGSSSPTGHSKDTNVCQVCLAAFGVFSSRRKFFCNRCRATVCNSCSKRVTLHANGKPRSGFDGLMDRLKESSDARLCLHCDTSSPLSRASSVASV
jgi:hypothetical protein